MAGGCRHFTRYLYKIFSHQVEEGIACLVLAIHDYSITRRIGSYSEDCRRDADRSKRLTRRAGPRI